MNYESLIFDIDGTLWDSRELVVVGYNRQLVAEGLDHLCVNAEQLKKLFGKTMTEIADIMLEEIPAPERYGLMERCMKSEDAYLHQHPCDTIAYEGVVETLEALAKKHRIFIVSNSQKGYPDLVMDKLNIRHLITDHLCFGDTGTSKGKTIRTLMERNGVTSAIYIGDTQGDYEATLEAGVPFIWCTFGFGEPAGYEAKVDTFPQLLAL